MGDRHRSPGLDDLVEYDMILKPEDKKDIDKQLDLVLVNLNQMEADMKAVLTNMRIAVKAFRDALLL